MRSRNGAVSDEHGITLRMTCNMTTYRYSFKMIVFLSLMFGQAAPDADVFRDWYSWHMECHRNNQTMLSWPMWMERGRSDLNVTYPVWFYGVEIHLLTGLNTSSFEPGLFVLDTAKSLCAKKLSTTIFSIPNISPTNLNDFQIAADIIQVPFWVQPVNVQAFVGAPITTLLCYLLDLDGLVKKENCSEKYSSVCVNATAHDTITYLGSTSSVPFYRSALTSSSRAKRLTDILLTIPITVFSVFIAMNRLFDNLS
ncbi:uncharacterized protein LOC127843071 isoform X3 [Dreissena polymorpha]|uniref:uncharacterized protein LOC127843071 isoform X3 n=1 Tax=Dreissena polymorpha TaxID=45954 RepID=UPI0022652053|nr:uncharacterized protein LOC127843071 isoform X3 [Dreissena polymorpha]